MINIFYKTPKGGHMMKTYPSMVNGGGQELERLYKRRTKAHAKNKKGEYVGETWKNEGRWTYWYDNEE